MARDDFSHRSMAIAEPATARFSRPRLFGLCSAFVMMSGAAWAQATPPTDPVLAKLIEESLTARPELARARASAGAEHERIPQAGALPDPVIQLGIQNDGFRGIEIGKMETSFYTIMGTQAFPWPGKRGLRGDLASLGARQADAAVERVRLSTEAEVRRAYLDMILARDRLTLLDRLEAIWQKSAGIARARYEAGEGAQSDVLRSQLELNRIKQRRWALQAQEKTRVQALNRLRVHPLEEAIVTSAVIRELGSPALGDEKAAVEDALSRSPELASVRLGVARAETAVALARKDYFPDLAFSAGVMPRGGQFDPMWQIGLAFNVPVYAGRKQSRAVAENEDRAVADRRNVEALEQVLRLRIQERWTALAALVDTIRLYDEGLLVQSKATADSTLAQYRVGRVSFASVLEANAGYIGDEDGYLQALAEAHRILIAVAEVSLEPLALSVSGGMGGAAVPGTGGMSGGVSGDMSKAGAAMPPASRELSSSMPKM